jgi:transposase
MAARKRDMKKESFWRRMVREQAVSGLSIRGWCRKHRLKETAFYWWRTQLARRDAQRSKSKTAFVPVRLAEDRSADTDGRIEIVLAGGRRVHIHGRVDRQMLSDVLAVLEGQEC